MHRRQPLDTGKRIIFCLAMLVLFRSLFLFQAVLLSLSGGNLLAATAPRYATIDESIARGDLDDVRAHVANDPAVTSRARERGLPLHQAILRNKTEIALFLLESGASPDAADRTQRTPLHLAVERGNIALVRALLERHAAPNERDAVGWTPLHHAAARDKLDVARALLTGGADPKTLSERGGTALHEAAASAGAAMIRLLLDAGVDPAVVSKNGVTALDIARDFKNEPAIAELSIPARQSP